LSAKTPYSELFRDLGGAATRQASETFAPPESVYSQIHETRFAGKAQVHAV
jgi:hypothetical protein